MSLPIVKKVPRMTRCHRAAVIVGLLNLFAAILLPAPARAGDPTEQVRRTVDKVLTIVRSSPPTSKAQMATRRVQLAEVIYPRFDFAEMAKRSLGDHWAGRRRDEQREFVTIFAAMMGSAFADNIESYSRQEILYIREREDPAYAEVDTQIVAVKEPPAAIKFQLHRVDNMWKVYDLVIEDISVVNYYRSQFDWVIGQSSFEALFRILRGLHS